MRAAAVRELRRPPTSRRSAVRSQLADADVGTTKRKPLLQLDNSQDWDYYGEGDPSSATGDCGGTYATPYCLIPNTISGPAPGRRQL